MAKGGKARATVNVGLAIDRETHAKLRAVAIRHGAIPSVWMRELIIAALDSGVSPFQRGWVEGYKAGYAAVMSRFTEAIAIERGRVMSGELDGQPVGFVHPDE